MKRSVGCTIVSKNYFAYAKTVANSFCAANPNAEFFILVVDRKEVDDHYVHPGSTVVFLEDLRIPDWLKIAFRFDVLELNTNVKASFLRHLLGLGYPAAYYFDPDIYCYRAVDVLDDALSDANILLTPHALSPTPEEDGQRPADWDFLKSGSYNLGFIGIRNTPESARFLVWWESRCLTQGFNEPSVGLFVDQKWIDLAPSYFDGVKIFKHPGCNMAYWNIHERRVVQEQDGSYGVEMSGAVHDLMFFHFSGINPLDVRPISKYQNRYSLEDRPDLTPLFVQYARMLLDNGFATYGAVPYGFSMFSNGSVISGVMRRYASSVASLRDDVDPFSQHSKTYAFALKHRLIPASKRKRSMAGLNSLTVDERKSRPLAAVGSLLRVVQYVLGAERFAMLNKFMRHYSVPNNQAKIMFRK